MPESIKIIGQAFLKQEEVSKDRNKLILNNKKRSVISFQNFLASFDLFFLQCSYYWPHVASRLTIFHHTNVFCLITVQINWCLRLQLIHHHLYAQKFDILTFIRLTVHQQQLNHIQLGTRLISWWTKWQTECCLQYRTLKSITNTTKKQRLAVWRCETNLYILDILDIHPNKTSKWRFQAVVFITCLYKPSFMSIYVLLYLFTTSMAL